MSAKNSFPELVLGTALWGWTVPRAMAFALLDTFYEAGFRRIDAATNYPINKVPEDFRRSEQILQEWINVNGVRDLSILMKVGSISNMGTPNNNLLPAFLLLNWRYYIGHFESNLGGLMIHWDNRRDKSAVADSLEVLKQVYDSGLEVGFSGVKYPEVYADLNRDFALPFLIQFKHNLLYSDYPRYAALNKKGRFYAYGINGGGIKLDLEAYHATSSLKVRGGKTEALPAIAQDLQQALAAYNQEVGQSAIRKMNEAAMSFALQSPNLSGVLIGPSNIVQLEESLAFYRKVDQGTYQDLFPILLNLHRQYAPIDRQI